MTIGSSRRSSEGTVDAFSPAAAMDRRSSIAQAMGTWSLEPTSTPMSPTWLSFRIERCWRRGRRQTLFDCCAAALIAINR
jgi:hypothetical protein